jgi:mRNA-degrading endonuclease toxin of MazEF toxin-antitoxin module
VSQYQHGQIVRAWVERHGKRKARPVLIVTPEHEIGPGRDLIVVCISTTIPDDPPSHHVLLPWQREGRARIGLNKRAAAICDWLTKIPESDVIESMGFAPSEQLRQINDALKRLEERQEDGQSEA